MNKKYIASVVFFCGAKSYISTSLRHTSTSQYSDHFTLPYA